VFDSPFNEQNVVESVSKKLYNICILFIYW